MNTLGENEVELVIRECLAPQREERVLFEGIQDIRTSVPVLLGHFLVKCHISDTSSLLDCQNIFFLLQHPQNFEFHGFSASIWVMAPLLPATYEYCPPVHPTWLARIRVKALGLFFHHGSIESSLSPYGNFLPVSHETWCELFWCNWGWYLSKCTSHFRLAAFKVPQKMGSPRFFPHPPVLPSSNNHTYAWPWSICMQMVAIDFISHMQTAKYINANLPET